MDAEKSGTYTVIVMTESAMPNYRQSVHNICETDSEAKARAITNWVYRMQKPLNDHGADVSLVSAYFDTNGNMVEGKV